MGRRIRKTIPLKADVVASNPVLLEGEQITIDNGGVLETWVGLDGVWNGSVADGTQFNNLPSKCHINNANNAGGVQNEYTTEAALYAGQANQTTKSIQRLSVEGEPDLWLEKLATSNGVAADYKGWITVIEEISYLLNTDSTGTKVTLTNIGTDRTIKKIKVECQTAPSNGDSEIDVQIENVSVFSSKPIIYAGVTRATTGILINTLWANSEVLTVHLNSINSVVQPIVSIEYEYEADFAATQEDVNRPTGLTLTPDDDTVTISFTPDPNATSHVIEFHSGDSNWTAIPDYNSTDISGIVHGSLASSQNYYYRVSSLATGLNTSGFTTGNTTTTSGAFVLSSISPAGNYDLSVHASVTTVSTKVRQLDNQLGAMGNLVQDTDAARLTYDDANNLMIGGGSLAMSLNIASLSWNNNTTTIEIYGVLSLSSTARQSIAAFTDATHASNYGCSWQIDSSTTLRLFKGDGTTYDTAISGAVTAFATGTKYIYKLSVYPGGMSIDVGGRTFSLSSTKAVALSYFIFSGDGIQPSTVYYGTRGSQHETIVVPRALSVGEESDVRSFLASKWSV